jgi:hypothetical protein
MEKNKNKYDKELQEYFEIYDTCHEKCNSDKIMNVINNIKKYDDINRLCKIDCISIIYKKLHNGTNTK